VTRGCEDGTDGILGYNRSMSGDLTTLPARSGKGAFHVVVESPRGSRVKIKYDPKLRAFKFARPLVAGLRYPYDWGFIPSTVGPDGDPLDAMVFSDLATFPGVVIECRALGVIRLEQNRKNSKGRERNDRLIAVPLKMPRFSIFHKPADLPLRWRQELEEFFVAAIRFEEKEPKILGWASATEGERMVNRCVPGSRHCMGQRTK
jgi:inorganic pyrophosphatase